MSLFSILFNEKKQMLSSKYIILINRINTAMRLFEIKIVSTEVITLVIQPFNNTLCFSPVFIISFIQFYFCVIECIIVFFYNSLLISLNFKAFTFSQRIYQLLKCN